MSASAGGRGRSRPPAAPGRKAGRAKTGRPQAASPLESPASGDSPPARRLPIPLTSFVGREQELAEVGRLLGRHRLVTLIGVGGAGKTRLALQAATEQTEQAEASTFRSGACWVELAPLDDPALVPEAVATALGLPELGRRATVDRLIEALEPQQLLLVLDNCEHLVSACTQLAAALLRACPQLKILATSREALGVEGEIAWPVPALAVPDLGEPAAARSDDPAAGLAYDAVRLFVERATAAQPAFRLTAENARAVVQVCRRLDGIPLAIELAAARTRVLTVPQIVERLDEALRLLTRGSPTAPSRHQTLKAAMDWSYDLLSAPERQLFRGLSVFAGGFALESAEAVCAAQDAGAAGAAARQEGSEPPLDASDVLDLLSELVDKSLVAVTALEPVGQARYRLLEPIRQYARDRLIASGEAGRLAARHLEHFLRLAEQAEPEIQGPQQAAWLDRLELEHDNLRAAFDWAVRHDAEAGLRLAGALFWFWTMRGHQSEGRQRLSAALAATETHPVTRARARALRAAGNLAYFQSDYAAAQAYTELCLAWAQQAGDKQMTGLALRDLGALALAQGDDAPKSRALIEQGLTLLTEAGDRPGIAAAQYALGHTYLGRNEFEQARRLYEASLAIRREIGDSRGIGLCLNNLGLVAGEEGDLAGARALFEECLALWRASGDKFGIAVALANLGVVAAQRRDYAEADSLQQQSLRRYREMGYALGIAGSLSNLGDLARGQGHLPQAAALYRESLTVYQKSGTPFNINQVLESMAALAVAERQPEHAARLLGAAQALRDSVGLPVYTDLRAEHDQVIEAARGALGEAGFTAAWAEGEAMDLQQAIAYGLAAEPTSRATAVPAELRISALGAGRVLRGATDPAPAEWSYARARALFFYLLMNPPQTKEQIGLVFWPDASPAQLRNSLGVALHHLRRALGRPEWVVFEDDAYAFNRSLPYWFDLEEFENKLDQARRLLRAGSDSPASTGRAIQLLEEAAGLYRGDFLEDLAEGDWAVPRRERLREHYVQARLTLGRLYLDREDYGRAAESYRQALARDPYLEAAQQGLMRSLARQGEPAQALQLYHKWDELLRKELGAPPDDDTRALADRLRRGEAI
jgi:non-specific serine/threonine protein kinase